MARYRFSLEEKIAGTRAALKSRYTPWQLRPALRVYLRRLLKQRHEKGR
jgi:hypothetical protein